MAIWTVMYTVVCEHDNLSHFFHNRNEITCQLMVHVFQLHYVDFPCKLYTPLRIRENLKLFPLIRKHHYIELLIYCIYNHPINSKVFTNPFSSKEIVQTLLCRFINLNTTQNVHRQARPYVKNFPCVCSSKGLNTGIYTNIFWKLKSAYAIQLTKFYCADPLYIV